MKPVRNSLVLILLAFSILLRLWRFWEPSFSGDEANFVLRGMFIARGFGSLISGQNIKTAAADILLPVLTEAHPPMEILVGLPVIGFQSREFFVRLMYIIIASVFLGWSYLKIKSLRNNSVALIYLLLFGTSVFAVRWSQIAMYQSLAMAAGLTILLAIINLLKNPSRSGAVFLSISSAAGLWIFPDFLLVAPAVVWAIYQTRSRLSGRDIFYAGMIWFLAAGSFYVPWIIFSVFFGDRTNGFNLFIYNKLRQEINVVGNIRGYWENFWSQAGVVTVWPFSALSLLLINKVGYIKPAVTIILFYLAAYVFKPGVAYWYFTAVFGILCLMAAEWLSRAGKAKMAIIPAIVILNLISLKPILAGDHSGLVFGGKGDQPDDIRAAGALVKACIDYQAETYVSTADFYKSFYYFGQPSLAYADEAENRIKTMELALNDNSRLKFIHYRKNQLPEVLESRLKQKAARVIERLFPRYTAKYRRRRLTSALRFLCGEYVFDTACSIF